MASLRGRDISVEIALIFESFKRSTTVGHTSTIYAEPHPGLAGEGFESTGLSSLDATLSEVHDQASVKRTQDAPLSRKAKKERKVRRRGVPMLEELSANTGWTRSFLSRPADPLDNPIWFGATYAIRIFPSRVNVLSTSFVVKGQRSL